MCCRAEFVERWQNAVLAVGDDVIVWSARDARALNGHGWIARVPVRRMTPMKPTQSTEFVRKAQSKVTWPYVQTHLTFHCSLVRWPRLQWASRHVALLAYGFSPPYQ